LKIRVTGDLLRKAQAVAHSRQANRKRARSHDFARGASLAATGLPGAISEVAFHVYWGAPIDWDFLATDAGFGKVDVGGLWEVRSTPRASNRLNLFKREISPSKLASPFAWIYVEDHLSDAPTCHLQGWARGWEIVLSGKLQTIDRGPCYYLDNRLLHPFPGVQIVREPFRACA